MSGREGMTEFELVKMQMNEKTDESLDVTRDMLRTCGEASQMGADTLVTLENQGEQLRRIDKEMDTIGENLKESERQIDALNACCCMPSWGKRKAKTEQPSQRSTTKTPVTSNGSLKKTQPQTFDKQGTQGVVKDRYVTRILNDEREDEMEENLQQVAEMVDGMRGMAGAMETELKAQNEILDRMDQKTEKHTETLTEQQKRADAYLGKSSKPSSSTDPRLAAAKMLVK